MRLSLLRFKSPTVSFTKDAFEQIKAFGERAKKIQGVDRVSPLLTLDDSFLIDGAFTFERAVPEEIPDDPEALKVTETRLVNNLLFSGRLVSPDGKRDGLIQMGEASEIDVRRDAIVAEVYSVADEMLLVIRLTPIGGVGVIYSGLNVECGIRCGIVCARFLFTAFSCTLVGF